MDFIIAMKIFVMIISIDLVKSISYSAKSKVKADVRLEKYKKIHNIEETMDEGNPLSVKLKNYLGGIDYGHLIPVLPLLIIKNATDHPKQIIRQNNAMLSKRKKKSFNLKRKKMKREHREKLRQIVNFLASHRLATNYLFDEVQRIKRGNIVKDELREMVSYLDKPSNADKKKELLDYFYHNILGEVYTSTTSMWDQTPNDLVINVLKDPFNDGVINK